MMYFDATNISFQHALQRPNLILLRLHCLIFLALRSGYLCEATVTMLRCVATCCDPRNETGLQIENSQRMKSEKHVYSTSIDELLYPLYPFTVSPARQKLHLTLCLHGVVDGSEDLINLTRASARASRHSRAIAWMRSVSQQRNSEAAFVTTGITGIDLQSCFRVSLPPMSLKTWKPKTWLFTRGSTCQHSNGGGSTKRKLDLSPKANQQ